MSDAPERRIERRNRREQIRGDSLEKFGFAAMKLGCSMMVLGIGLPILAVGAFLLLGSIAYLIFH
jgi:hypothetical protein